MKKPSSRKSGHENLSHPSMKTGQNEPETGKSFPGNGKHESKEKEKSQTGLAWTGGEPEKISGKGKRERKCRKKRRGRPDGKPYRPLLLIPFPHHAAARENAASTWLTAVCVNIYIDACMAGILVLEYIGIVGHTKNNTDHHKANENGHDKFADSLGFLSRHYIHLNQLKFRSPSSFFKQQITTLRKV